MCLFRILPGDMGYLLKTCLSIEPGQQTEEEDAIGSRLTVASSSVVCYVVTR